MESVYYKQILGDRRHPIGYVDIEEVDVIECFDYTKEIRLSKFNNTYYVAIYKPRIGLSDETFFVLVIENKYHLLRLIKALTLQGIIKRKIPEYRMIKTEFNLDDVAFFEKEKCFAPQELNEFRSRLSPIIKPEIMEIITGKRKKIIKA